MRYRPIGKSGIEASAVAFGAWAIGGWMWGGADESDAIRAIHTAIDSGINLIDTAPVYGFGRSEEVVGKAISGRRDKVVLATKVGLIWHKEKGELFFASDEKHPKADGKIKIFRCLALEEMRYEVEQSLRRLKTDRIDLLQTHWQTSTTPVADTMGELMRLKEDGKIRAIGCSNATSEQMDEYRAAGQLDSDQEPFSMLDRRHEAQNLPYVKEKEMAFLAYSPLAQGLLTGKVGPERVFSEGDQRRNKERFSVDNRRRISNMLEGFRPIADARGATIAQLVIAWTISQPGCTHALVGARNPRQAEENAGAGDIELSAEELSKMRETIEEFGI